jgi:hypothetical protein
MRPAGHQLVIPVLNTTKTGQQSYTGITLLLQKAEYPIMLEVLKITYTITVATQSWGIRTSATEIECRTRVISTPASYSEDLGFKSRPDDRIYWGIYWFSSVTLSRCQYSTLHWRQNTERIQTRHYSHSAFLWITLWTLNLTAVHVSAEREGSSQHQFPFFSIMPQVT